MLHWTVTERAGEKSFLEMPHILYYEFSVRAFTKFQEIKPALQEALKDESTDGNRNLENLLYENRMAMNDVLVYGALSLEAYINYYAMKYDIPFHRDLERSLSTVNKWKMYTNNKTRKTLDQDSIKTIKRVFSLRDEIVHPKPERVQADKTAPSKGKSAQAQIEILDKGQLIIDINNVFKSVLKIDNDEKKEYDEQPWLHELRKTG